MSKKILLTALVLGAFLSLGLVAQAATSSLTASETVGNTIRGTDDQLATFSTSTANVVAVQSVDDITLTAITMGSTSARSLVIDGCTISFDATAQDLNCTTAGGLVANINTASSTTAIHQAANFSQMLFNNYTASASTTNTSAFRLTHKNAAVNGYVAINGPSLGSVATSSVTTGYAAVAEIDHIVLAGTIDAGDVFTLGSASTTYSYTVVPAATTLRLIADGLYYAFQNAAGSSTEGFTLSTTTGNTIILTARTAGTGITSSSTATNYLGVAQQITFTPASVTRGETFKISINSRDYSYQAINDDGVAQVVAGLVVAAASDPIATCVNTANTTVTCTAKTSGTAFTSYYAQVIDAPTASVTSSGGGGGWTAPVVVTVKDKTKPVVTVITPAFLTKTLSYGKYSAEVKLLQEKLKALGLIKASQKTTTYFGVVTKAALIKFQRANSLKPYTGVLNTKTRSLLNSL